MSRPWAGPCFLPLSSKWRMRRARPVAIHQSGSGNLPPCLHALPSGPRAGYAGGDVSACPKSLFTIFSLRRRSGKGSGTRRTTQAITGYYQGVQRSTWPFSGPALRVPVRLRFRFRFRFRALPVATGVTSRLRYRYRNPYRGAACALYAIRHCSERRGEKIVNRL